MRKLQRISSRTNNVLVLPFPQRLFSSPKTSFSANLKFLLISGIVFIILFLSIYIFQISSVISQGYQIQNYEKKIDTITEGNKILEINTIKINSLENIDSKIQALGFEKIEKVHYIQILEGSAVTTGKRVE